LGNDQGDQPYVYNKLQDESLKNLAPIGISTYSRINHLKQTVEALQKNTLAKESELYIFSDAPQKGDEEIVTKVREYIHTVDGFKKIHIVEREINGRVSNNRGGMKQLLDEYGKMIWLEDDNVVSSSFLKYMNDGLDFYEKNKKIVAISGYNVPAKFPDDYVHDYYFSSYFNAWGFATWADRGFLDIVNYNDQYNEMMADKKLCKKVRKVHPKLINGMKLIQEGKLNAGDYKVVFHLIKNDLFTIKPIKSFVDNIGHDGSGVHCGVNDRFQNIKLNKQEIKFVKDLKYNEYIDKIYYYYFQPKINIIYRIKNKLLRLMFK